MLEQEFLSKLPSEAQAEARDFEQLFGSKGWKRVEKYLEDSIEELEKRLVHVNTWDENRLLYGKLYGFKEIVNLEQATEAQLRAVVEQQIESEQSGFELEYE